MAVNKRDDATGHRDDLLHRGIGAKRIPGPRGARQYAGQGHRRLLPDGQQLQVLTAQEQQGSRRPAGRKGVPCSIDGAARATGDGKAGGFGGGMAPEEPETGGRRYRRR